MLNKSITYNELECEELNKNSSLNVYMMNQKNKNLKDKYLMISFAVFIVLIFMSIPIFELIYMYNLNDPIMCNIRLVNGSKYEFLNNNVYLGNYEFVDVVKVDRVCELVCDCIFLIIMWLIYLKFSVLSKMSLRLCLVFTGLNALRYICFEVIVLMYVFELYSTCRSGYFNKDVEFIINKSAIEDIIIVRLCIGLIGIGFLILIPTLIFRYLCIIK